MPSKQTENYHLSQWEAEDQVLRTDFNADNAKIDAALKEHADLLPKKGNCRIVFGTYTGTGSAYTLTFDGKPLFVLVRASSNSMGLLILAPYGMTNTYVDFGQTELASLSWGTNSLKITNKSFNQSNWYYTYIALLAADE